eukprot:1568450-Amphidinium_carterae.1
MVNRSHFGSRLSHFGSSLPTAQGSGLLRWPPSCVARSQCQDCSMDGVFIRLPSTSAQAERTSYAVAFTIPMSSVCP